MATTLADAIARHRADRLARGLPPTICDPAVLRVVGSILASDRERRASDAAKSA